MTMPRHQKPPLLLVPGALNGGWVWQDNFLPFFERTGFDAHTLDFPSHGARGLRRQMLGLANYRQHLVEKITAFSRPPILIAHSLGGLISLQAMHLAPVAAVALLSPVPPDGVLRSMLSLARRSPMGAAKMIAAITDARLTRIASAPAGIYSSTSDPDGAIRMTAQLRSESLLALTQALWQPMPKVKAPAPLHFFGATGDHIIPADEVRRAARFYDAPVTIYEGMSHAFQVERDWQQIAGDILNWLTEEKLAGVHAKRKSRPKS